MQYAKLRSREKVIGLNVSWCRMLKSNCQSQLDNSFILNKHLYFKKISIYLATPDLNRSMRNPNCSMWDPVP